MLNDFYNYCIIINILCIIFINSTCNVCWKFDSLIYSKNICKYLGYDVDWEEKTTAVSCTYVLSHAKLEGQVVVLPCNKY